MNRISDEISTGTLGELLVQIRLLQYGIQAAPPLKDTGNDLIAVKTKVFRAIQVKTTTGKTYHKGTLPEHYHIMAVVGLQGQDSEIFLDNSKVFLIPKPDVKGLTTYIAGLKRYELTRELVALLFSDDNFGPCL
jgi:hypothetical protein